MKLFILGSTGLLGSSLVRHLKGTNKFSISTHSTADGDLSDENIVLKVLSKAEPDIIINLVALTNVDESESNPQKAYLLNGRVVENISKWLESRPSSTLIQISTDHVYDEAGENTEDKIILRNYYAYSKYLADLVVKNSNGIVLRTNFFGKSLVSTRTSFTDWIYDALVKKKSVNLFHDVYFSPLSINTLCKMIELVVSYPNAGIFNLGSRAGTSKAEFALNFSKKLGMDLNHSLVSIDENPLKAKRPKNMMMNVSKFEKTFNVRLPTLDEEIDSVKKDYL